MSGFVSDGASVMVTLWVLAWGIRRRGELDHSLDANAKWIRWSVVVLGVLVGFGLGPTLNSVWVAATGWLIATAFLAWPNFAYYLARLFTR